MKEISVICTLALLVTGCSATGTNSPENVGSFISSSLQDISKSLLSTPVNHKMDEQGWITAYKVPKNAPEYHIDINKPSVKKSGSTVQYKVRTVYLKPERIGERTLSKLADTSYTFNSGDYIASDVLVNCANQTYALGNSVFFDYKGNKLMNCPWKDMSNTKMGSAKAGSIIENTISSACK